MALGMSSSPGESVFIHDVIDFIDQPLSPTTLNKLKRSCKAQPGYSKSPRRHYSSPGAASGINYSQPLAAGPGGSRLADLFPLGIEIEAQHLHNTREFNGLRGYVVGHQDDKVLVEFHGGNEQVFDIPPQNLRVVNPAGLRASGVAGPPGMSPLAYTSPIPTESLTLQTKLKLALSHVEAAKEAMIIATQLHAVDPDLLYNTIAEFQPTLSRANIARNWAKVIQIYQVHADRVEAGISPGSRSPRAAPASPGTRPSAAPVGDDDMVQSLEGVINFIDAPLSPRTLKEMRTIRHSLSPKRERSSSPMHQPASLPITHSPVPPPAYLPMYHHQPLPHMYY